MSDTGTQRDSADLMDELAAGMTGMASELDFVVASGIITDSREVLIRRTVAHITSTCAQLEVMGYQGELCQFRDAAQRGAAFLASNGRNST